MNVRRKPYDPSKGRIPVPQFRAPRHMNDNQPKAHDRRAQDIPLNAEIAPVEVQNPLTTTGERDMIVAVRNISRDTLAWMHSHKWIDDAKFQAGRKWQLLYERAAIGSVQSVDTSKEPVDGGRWPDMLTDDCAAASAELARLNGALNVSEGLPKTIPGVRAVLVRDVLGVGMSIKVAVSARGEVGDTAERRWSKEFKAALEVLAGELGFATKFMKSGVKS